ncbi:hypothetical protein AZL_d00430 (plasmid) [Azospirillum sp. B510]|uniref:hypothetical protein n=1 Tax=Azospirillum sp. (strain B510) TaxID=137722 RepID=UPI0001C4CBD1|nr:hypothetical protein [Azospirillum sp. B510]BAI75869.1 hypothetical protein AZL_d00430 [Azospirillum sp. B510]
MMNIAATPSASPLMSLTQGKAKASQAAAPAQSTTKAEGATSTSTARSADGGKKDFATVAKDARAALDAAYQSFGKTGENGNPIGQNGTTAKEWQNLLSGLDRRSLYAIASNEGGQFNQSEQIGAENLMDKQLNDAMGLDQATAAAGKLTSDMFLKGVRFMDGVSDEEKTSMFWAEKRAGLQFSYEGRSRQEGKEPENVDSESPLAKLIKGGLENLRRTGDPSRQLKDTPEYRQAVQLSEQLKAGLAAKSASGGRAVDLTA